MTVAYDDAAAARPALQAHGVGFRYRGEPGLPDGGDRHPLALADVTLGIADGEFVVLCGQSGCGKTTFTRLLNGLIPSFHTGDLTGACTVYGLECGQAAIEEYAALVGSVFQNPKTQYFNAFVADELAFPCENAGWEPARIRGRVDEVAQRFGIAHLLDRSIFRLSGGEKQRIAVASACMLRPRLLVLDEPTSNLDRRAMDDLAALLGDIKRMGVTIVVAEHRLAWCAGLADRYVLFESGRIVGDHTAARFAAIPEARREAMGLRTLDVAPFRRRVDALAARWPERADAAANARAADDAPPRPVESAAAPGPTAPGPTPADSADTVARLRGTPLPESPAAPPTGPHAVPEPPLTDDRTDDTPPSPRQPACAGTATPATRDALLSTRGLVVGHRPAGRRWFRRRCTPDTGGFSRPIPDLDLFPGEIVGVMGHNGAGKSTLVRTLVGLARPLAGDVLHRGAAARPRTLMRAGFLVMQDVNYQLFADSVRGELLLGTPGEDDERAAIRAVCDAVLRELDLTGLADRHPMSLSGGQKQRTAIASALVCGKELIVLDEPTSGLDRRHMVQVGMLLRRLAERGKAVLVVTHDEELAAAWCDRILDLDAVPGRPERTPGRTAGQTNPIRPRSPSDKETRDEQPR